MSTFAKSGLLFLTLSIISIPFFFSCGDESLIQFDVNYDLPRIYFNYPSSSFQKNEMISLYTGEAKINLDSILSVNKIPEGFIKSAYLNRFILTLTDPPEANFDWLQSANVLVSANSSIDPGAEVAYIDTVNPGNRILTFKLRKVDMIPYMNDTTFYYQLSAAPSGVLPYPVVSMYLDLQIRLHIEAF